MISLSVNTATLVATFIGIAIVGFVAIYGQFDKSRRKRIKEDNTEADKASGNLIGILQTTVEELTKKVDVQSGQITTLEGKVEHLEKTNKILTDVLQGRDKTALESQALIKDTHDIVKNLSESMARLAMTMDSFMKVSVK